MSLVEKLRELRKIVEEQRIALLEDLLERYAAPADGYCLCCEYAEGHAEVCEVGAVLGESKGDERV